VNLSVRSTLPEVMDGEDISDAIYQRCLSDLASVNRFTFTHRPVLRWLAKAIRALPAGASFSVLDVAYGQGDLLRAISRWAARRGLRASLSGIDLNPRSAIAASRVTPAEMAIDYKTGDVFAYTPESPVDFIVSSQFAHHLSDTEIVELLRWLERNSLRGWYVADLHRHVIPYYGFRILAGLMGWHRIVSADGTISIARSFRRREWQALIGEAGLQAEISWHMAFRLCVGRIK
jgi:2-polyprenyl-3-methyl-5-hydroxy-6-metoxy-1,4-benzoquinol methylase